MKKTSLAKSSFIPNTPIEQRPVLNGPEPAFELLKKHWDPALLQLRIDCKLVVLTGTMQVLGVFDLSAGSVDRTLVDPAMIFLIATSVPGARNIVLATNHPSGVLKPTESDVRTAKLIQQAGKLLNIPLLDFLILTSKEIYSMDEHGDI